MTDLAQLHIDGRIATLRLNRPGVRNALSIELLTDLHRRVGELESAEGVSVVVITGEGGVFCSGMDLKQVLSEPEAPLALLTSLARLTLRIRRLPMAVVARVMGAAIGGGCGLACVCDFAVTHADAKMGFPEVDLGLCPAVVAPWVVRRAGSGRARAILLRGGVMTGREAFEAGLATHLADSAKSLDEAVARLTDNLKSAGPAALAATKGLLNELDGSLDEDLLIRAAELSASILNTPEAREALSRALSK